MDPFSAEGELLTIHNAFHQGQYQVVLDFDPSSLSKSNVIPARVLKLRAQIASGDAKGAVSSVKNESGPDFAAVKAFAQHTLGDMSTAMKQVEQLVESSSENATVQILGGIVLQLSGRTEEALSLLSKHQGNLEAIALVTQIHLQQNRTDLALKEVSAARKWAQDSLLVNIAESWVGMRVGGESYQSAFYVFEEMAQTPSSTSTKSLVSQAISELHLGRLPEAEAALNQALENEPKDVEAVANAIVLATIMGKSAEQQSYLEELKRSQANHPLLTDLKEKSDLFDQAAGKYAAKVA
ncbi:MAG: hypothetical protein L6R35_003021 [Caloplaca aegaea]|nr:MAG: hypothetical protein L6R35_003021 [Caloplaca aegaea]